MDIFKDLNIEFSSIDYDSTLQFFFIKDVENIKLDNSNSAFIRTNDIFCNLDLENIPDFLLTFYNTINTVNRELYINNWTFLSFNKIIKIKTNYLKDNIKAIDIAFTYIGMGYVLIAFYDIKTKTIKIRFDGGSNGFDREYNYYKLKQFYNEPNISIVTSETFTTFNELLIYIKNYKNSYL
tara:strand:+ start:20 stop:562 length:543 start_codon:yes stop_codon:yes gene_type:complete